MAKEKLTDRLRNKDPLDNGKWMKRSEISTAERGIKYVLKLLPDLNCACFQVDGNLINDAKKDKCDRLILIDDDNFLAEIYIELKGVDVNHAVDQLEDTLKDDLFQNTLYTIRRARIVSKSVPSNASRSKIEKAKRRFLKKFKCELRTIKSMNPEKLIKYTKN